MALTRTPSSEARTRLGRYELLRELTASSVGASWLARQTGETFEVNLLKVHRHMAKSPTAVEGLLSEAQAARKFAHDNVAGVLDAGVVDGEPFIVSEYVGETLTTLLRNAGPSGLPLPVALRIGLDLLEGFAGAYGNEPPLGHGEIGPWCVYVGSDGISRVGGFAVDQAIWRFGAHYVKNMERLSYAAPERVKAMSTTLGQELSVPDEESDLFSAAVLVFELVTKHKLFSSKMEAAVVQKVLTSSIPTAASVRNEVPLVVSDTLKRALQRDRSERFGTFDDFIIALEGVGASSIASKEDVAAFVASSRSGTNQAAATPVVAPPAPLLAGAQTLYTGTPKTASSASDDKTTAARKRADSRATLMFDERTDVSPAPPTAATKAALGNGASPQPPVVAPAAATAPAPTASSPGNVPALSSRQRAKTLMGFGGLRTLKEGESPVSPPTGPGLEPKPAAPDRVIPPAPRSSSIELDDADIDVQIEDPLSFPTMLLEVPRTPSAAAAPPPVRIATPPAFQAVSPPPRSMTPPAVKAAVPPARSITPAGLQAAQPPSAAAAPKSLPPLAPLPPPATPARKRPPARRMVTLLGIQAPEDEEGVPLGEDGSGIEDEATLMDPAQENEFARRAVVTKLNGTPKPLGAKLGAPPKRSLSPSTTPAVSKPLEPERISISDEPTHELDDGALELGRGFPSEDGTPASPLGRSGNKRSVTASERLRTGGVLSVSGKNFELIAPVARGGMATVWAARASGSKNLADMVAIKTMLPEISDDPDFESMFLDEARVAAKIRHPNVASIIDLGEDQGLLYLVMEWVDGETIGAIQRAARTAGGIPTSIIVKIAADACAGLHEAHELKDDKGHSLEVVHRDISPANVLVDAEGRTKIVDFGIAKSKGRLHVTKVGAMVKGKTPYLSPEQIGGLAIDRRSDLFSMGALLYVMSTGLHPFRGETELSTIENIAIKAAAPLRSIVPDIDPDFEKLVLKLLEKDPKKRFPNALEVKGELERIAAKLPKPASTEDVAAFVDRVIGDKLAQRRDMLKAGLKRIESGVEPPPDPMVKPPSAVDQIMAMIAETERQTAAKAGLAEPASATASSGTSDVAAGLPAFSSASSLEPAPSTKTTATKTTGTDPGSKAVTKAAIEAAISSESIPAPGEGSNVKRLVALIAMGLVIGLAIVGGLELFRSSETPTTPSARPTAVSNAEPTTTAQTSEPVAASNGSQAEPAITASASASPSASETAGPSDTASPSAPSASQAPSGVSAPPPHGAPWHPGSPAHPPVAPPGKPKTPPRKYNPPSI